jgi:hypothetical protein
VTHSFCPLESLTETLDIEDTSELTPKLYTTLEKDFFEKRACLISCELAESCTGLA